MLSDSAIRRAVEGRSLHHQGLAIEPYDEARLNPASYDLTLSPVHRVMRVDCGSIDTGNLQPYTWRREAIDWILLAPGEFILAATNEIVRLPNDLAGRVEGKSSLGRLGLAVHITAGFIDPGFEGSITLEIANLMQVPIMLHPHMRIAQIAFEPVQGVVERPYGQTGHYQGQPAGEPVESRYRL